MLIEDCFNLGYIAKLHGYKGEVSLFLDVTDPSKYQSLKLVYLEMNKGELIPFSIRNSKLMNKGFVTIQFDNVDSESQAKLLLKKNVFLPLTMLPPLGDTEFYDHEIIGFNVFDVNEGNVGIVVQVIDLPSNPLLQLEFEDKEVLIPLIPGLVKNVDRNSRILTVQSPEGLMDLFK
jgi:16S rRNA processing protein RimM